MISREALLNDFATRSFRDIGDQDYIAARLACRASLRPQFKWSGLQAIEKYLKAILLYNRVEAGRVGHSLEEALKCCEKLPFEMSLTEETHQMIGFLDESVGLRYLEVSYLIHGPKLYELDRAVWEVRRYCKVLDYKRTMPNGETESMLGPELAAIEQARKKPFHTFRLPGGLLERILDNPKNPARSALIWQNAFFGSRGRRSVSIPTGLHAVNAPLWLSPEIVDDVSKYVRIPKEVAKAYRNELQRRQTMGVQPAPKSV
jgi:HEPN domain-containing protein